MANSDNKVFDLMTAAADKTAVDLFPVEFEKSTDSIHNALMAAGMTPAYGNVADLADAALYALEGEFGDAAWSSAAAIPVIGQMVSAKKALKVAKEAGEEMVTLYRGIADWVPGKMAKKGKFVGGRHSQWNPNKPHLKYSLPEGSISVSAATTGSRVQEKIAWEEAKVWSSRKARSGKDRTVGKSKYKSLVLEFEMPRSEWEKLSRTDVSDFPLTWPEGSIFPPPNFIIHEGLPKEFLKKVHK